MLFQLSGEDAERQSPRSSFAAADDDFVAFLEHAAVRLIDAQLFGRVDLKIDVSLQLLAFFDTSDDLLVKVSQVPGLNQYSRRLFGNDVPNNLEIPKMPGSGDGDLLLHLPRSPLPPRWRPELPFYIHHIVKFVKYLLVALRFHLSSSFFQREEYGGHMTKKDLLPFLPLLPVGAGFLAAALSGKAIIGIIVFAATFPGVIYQLYPVYRDYMTHNPENVWFKRKLYGWGWTPVKWQGWLTILVYVTAVGFVFSRIDSDSYSTKDTIFQFIIPFLLLTAAFVTILLKKGEKPGWQWGKEKKD